MPGFSIPCLHDRNISIPKYQNHHINNSRLPEVVVEPDNCFLLPTNATHEHRSDRIQMITFSKFPSQARLQCQLFVMPRNFPRYHRRDGDCGVLSYYAQSMTEPKRKISRNLLQKICFIPLNSISLSSFPDEFSYSPSTAVHYS